MPGLGPFWGNSSKDQQHTQIQGRIGITSTNSIYSTKSGIELPYFLKIFAAPRHFVPWADKESHAMHSPQRMHHLCPGYVNESHHGLRAHSGRDHFLGKLSSSALARLRVFLMGNNGHVTVFQACRRCHQQSWIERCQGTAGRRGHIVPVDGP